MSYATFLFYTSVSFASVGIVRELILSKIDCTDIRLVFVVILTSIRFWLDVVFVSFLIHHILSIKLIQQIHFALFHPLSVYATFLLVPPQPTEILLIMFRIRIHLLFHIVLNLILHEGVAVLALNRLGGDIGNLAILECFVGQGVAAHVAVLFERLLPVVALGQLGRCQD